MDSSNNKNVLKKHLPFVEKMLSKVKGTKFETKWRNTMNLIISDRELTIDQIKQLDERLNSFAETYYYPKSDNASNEPTSSLSDYLAKDTPACSKLTKRDDEIVNKDTSSTEIQENNKSVKERSRSPRKVSSPSKSRNRQSREERTPSSSETTDLKQLLSNISMSDNEPEKALEAIEHTLGSENLLKLQNLLLKGIVKKNFSSTPSPPKKEEIKGDAKKPAQEEMTASPANPENSVIVQKRPPKRKLNELEKLQQDISGRFDGEAVYRSSLQGRTCAKKTEERVSEIMVKERDNKPKVTTRSKDSKPIVNEEIVNSTNSLKELSILAIKLDVTEEDVPIIVNDSMDEKYINAHLKDLKTPKNMMEVEDSSSEEYGTTIKKEHIGPTFKPTTATRSVAKKRIRNNWAKGFIRKTKRAKPVNEWEDVEKEKPKSECEAKMKLEKFSKLMHRDYMDDGECTDDDVNDSDVDKKDIPTTAMDLQCDENLDVLNETDYNLLEEISSQELNNSLQTQNEASKYLVSTKQSPAEKKSSAEQGSSTQTFPKIKQEKISDMPIALPVKITPPPPPKIVKLSLPSAPQAIIKPIQQTTAEERKIFEFKKIKIPPNPTQNNLIRVEPKTKTVAPFTIRLKDISTLKVYPSTQSSPFPPKTTPVILQQTSISSSSSPFPPKTTPVILQQTSISSSSSSSRTSNLFYTMSKVEQPVLPRMEPTSSAALPSLEIKQSFAKNSSTLKSIVLPPQLGGNKVPVILPQILSSSLNTNNSGTTEDILRPWMNDPAFKCGKQRSTCMKMLNKYCLAALFKCMGTTCCFFTNDKHLFQIHVELHLKLQSKDVRNCLVCAYCSYLSASIVGLIRHVESEHRFDTLSCNLCFYRTFNEYQLYLNHYPKYHEGAERVAIVLENQLKKPPKGDLVFIKNTLGSNVNAFTCIFPGCGKRFFVLEVFNEHLQSHKEKVSTKCLGCKQNTTPENIFEHYFSCYGFGMIQCVYCSFGTSTMQFIDDHLSTNHPSRSPYFAERLLSTSVRNNPSISLSSIETLTIKLMSKKVEGGVKYTAQDKELLNNIKNIGNLSGDVEGRQTTPQIKLTSNSSLQIESVVSLNEQSITN